jgi:hypothetical protein
MKAGTMLIVRSAQDKPRLCQPGDERQWRVGAEQRATLHAVWVVAVKRKWLNNEPTLQCVKARIESPKKRKLKSPLFAA